MTTTLCIRLPFGALLALLLSACATTPHWDSQFGESVRGALASQVANPAAVRNPDPVSGLDGKAARAAQESYEHSFNQSKSGAGASAPMVGSK